VSRARRTALALLCVGVLACGKQEGAPKNDEKPTSSPSAQPVPSAELPAKAPSVALEVAGSYDAKVGAVRTPEDAPKFIDVEAGALGPGTIELVLPAADGPVVGKLKGALGSQTLSGYLEDGRLTGTLLPDIDASPRMWGFVLAEVKGEGEQRTAVGTLRAGNENGRTVRESALTLKKK
jgi:hypothetical protein